MWLFQAETYATIPNIFFRWSNNIIWVYVDGFYLCTLLLVTQPVVSHPHVDNNNDIVNARYLLSWSWSTGNFLIWFIIQITEVM